MYCVAGDVRVRGRLLFPIVLALLALPGVAFAQASIAGVVRDTSGAVLPGVTVEASSPVLIERTRSVVTDGNGAYRVIDLRPGTYDVTFTLTGFSTVKREGLELTGSATATVNVELRVGALEETVTVTGETPIVDVQNAVRQRVLSKEIVDSIPTGKYYANLAALVPGVTIAGAPASAAGGTQDVGGTSGDSQATLSVHGSRGGDQRFTINGVPFGEGNGSTHGMGPNVAAMQEVSVDTGAVDASMGQGGVRINFVPRDGGNRFSGGIGFSGANAAWQGKNIDADLVARGATEGNRVSKLYDVSPVFGGPVVRDRLWFFASWRRNVVNDFVANGFYNKNSGNPNLWTFEPDRSRQIVSENLFRYAGARFTWQANSRNKIGFSYDLRDRCSCPQATTALESGMDNAFKPMNLTSVNWSAPLTSRLLMDAGVTYLDGKYYYLPTSAFVRGAIPVTEQSPLPGYPGTYRGRLTDQTTNFPTLNMRYSVSYVTGTHSLTSGFQLGRGKNAQITYAENPEFPVLYTVNRGVPTQVQIGAYPVFTDARTGADVGLYVQDKWTKSRLTVSGGLRFDYLHTYAAPVTLGPAPMLPTRNLSFPKTDMLRWKDLTPKASAIYDLFGNGRTAIKGSINRYVQQQAAGGVGSINLNPVALVQNTATRAWTDTNGNFIPDCDLLNGTLQDNRATGGDLCGAWTGASANFGQAVPGTTSDPDTQFGWGKRPFNWEASAAVQHGLTSRVSAEFAFFRRWYGNFFVIDNLAATAADYTSFSVTAPTDARLPNGGGYRVDGVVNINPDKATVPVRNYQTYAKNYGKQQEHWTGFDLTLNARLGRGVLFQGGTSTGRTSTNVCEIVEKVPEALLGATNLGAGNNNVWMPMSFCSQQSPWLTQFKGLGSYTVPVVDVQVSGTYQTLPGPQRVANLVVPTAVAQQTLGRPLSGNASNITVNVLEPGQIYGDRLHQFDLRVAKLIRYKSTRSSISVDIFNLFNGNAVTAENNAYTAWQTPTAILAPRILKFTAQLDF